MKYRIIATLVMLLVLAAAFLMFGGNDHRTSGPQSDDPGGIVIH